MLRTTSAIFLLTVISVCSAADITHDILVTGHKTYICTGAHDDQATVVWTYDKPTREGWVLENGNVLLAITKGGAYPGGGAEEVTRDGKVVWSYRGQQGEVHSIQKTSAGTYVVTEGGPEPLLYEISADGNVVAKVPLACQKKDVHMQTRMARKLADGSYLAPHLLDFAVIQYAADGTVLNRIDTTVPGDADHKIKSWPFTAIRLPDGNTLVGMTRANRVAEFDAKGAIVWEITNDDVGGIIKDACGVQRLPNGNTIINCYGAKPGAVRLFEITRDKKIVWSWTSADKANVHNMHVFATNGEPLPAPALR